MSADAKAAFLHAHLIDWFREKQADLPWRRNRTPYRVWVSEIMLQQTQVSTVIPYFEAFVSRFPGIASLADASQDDLLKVWEGLGYYARARHMQQAAQQMVTEHAGELPRDASTLRRLPGIGDYVAGMILSLAYGQDVPALDVNGYRVLARLCAEQQPIDRTSTRRRLLDVARELIPAGSAGEFNEALIELGALVCTARQPACEACPLSGQCLAFARQVQHMLPVRRPRRAPPPARYLAVVSWTSMRGVVTLAAAAVIAYFNNISKPFEHVTETPPHAPNPQQAPSTPSTQTPAPTTPKDPAPAPATPTPGPGTPTTQAPVPTAPTTQSPADVQPTVTAIVT